MPWKNDTEVWQLFTNLDNKNVEHVELEKNLMQ